jgi:hypothetical protein
MKLHKPWLRARLSKFHRSEASVLRKKGERIGRNPKTVHRSSNYPSSKYLSLGHLMCFKDRMNGTHPETDLNENEDE